MKSLRPLFLLIFLFPVFGFAQSLNGVYTGVLSNDSTTIRKDQSFEMALTEYRGKVFGYAYSTFIIHDTLYYIVKRVKGKVEGDICEVEDDEVISHNFPQKPEKKVYVTYTLRRNAADSVWRLDGNWKTNLVQKRKYGYYSISGKVETKEEKDLSKSKLYEHLGDLDLQKTLAFEKPKEKAPETKPVKAKEDKDAIAKNNVKKEDKKNTQPTETKPDDKKTDASIAKTDIKATDKKTETPPSKTDTKASDNKTNPVAVNNPPLQNEKKDLPVSNPVVVDKKPENNIAKTETRFPDNKTVPATTNNSQVQNVNKSTVATNTSPTDKKSIPENKTTSTPANNPVNQPAKKDVVNTTPQDKKSEPNKTDSKLVSVPVGYTPSQNPVITNPADKKPDQKLPDNKSTNTPANNQKDVAVVEKKKDAGFEFQEVKRTDRKLKPAATLVDGRVTIPSETIFFKSDSLSIALYDNGEVDGDSVSVIINDEMFIEKQLLKSSAFKKTYYVPQGQSDSLLVVLYADNLGKYPPNTGLLQIKDGEEIFYVRFKADLDRNAAIVLRRKSK